MGPRSGRFQAPPRRNDQSTLSASTHAAQSPSARRGPPAAPARRAARPAGASAARGAGRSPPARPERHCLRVHARVIARAPEPNAGNGSHVLSRAHLIGRPHAPPPSCCAVASLLLAHAHLCDACSLDQLLVGPPSLLRPLPYTALGARALPRSAAARRAAANRPPPRRRPAARLNA